MFAPVNVKAFRRNSICGQERDSEALPDGGNRMIRSVCMICGVEYGIKEDGSEGVRDSHGYCQRHYDEAMIAIQNEFAELPADVMRTS